MAFTKMKFIVATILLLACAAVQGRSGQVHPMISMLDYRMGLNTRIIDGKTAHKGMFPWQAALITTRDTGTMLCGGSLISDQWILTAAHCIIDALDITVQLGGVNLWSDMEYTQTSYKFMYHEEYDAAYLENDVALVALPVPVTLSANVQIIPLAARSHPDPTGRTVRVSGYGTTLDGDTSILHWVDLTAIDNSECSKDFPGAVYPTTLCARGAPNHSTCYGDSGGALIELKPNPVQIGVVSFVHKSGCALGRASGYARVTTFLDWISEKTGIPVRD